MKNLTSKLTILFAFLMVISTVQAQSNEELDEIRDLCTDLVVTSGQTKSSAHKVIVFSQNGNRQQLERSVNSTGAGLDEVIVQLGRLRRIADGIISNQRSDSGGAYRRQSQSIQNSWNGNTRFPQALEELAAEMMPLMDMIKDLAQEIRVEVVQMKNSNN